MARRLRIQFPGAIYHVINRGNYRRDLFETTGAVRAFEAALGEACVRFGWQLHAFVIMRNHFHLAVTTASPNLVEGMHWLQTTFAVSFNRFRSESGHLFQGRYQALLVEDDDALSRVVDYIHLNPVRAGAAAVENVGEYAQGSLRAFLGRDRSVFLQAERWLTALGLTDTAAGWMRYLSHLRSLVQDTDGAEAMEAGELSRGWAIGTDAWRQALAREHAHLSLEVGYEADEIREITEARWRSLLHSELSRACRTQADLAGDAKGARWKVAIARRLREEAGAPYAWIARHLHMRSAATVRVAVCRLRHQPRPPARTGG